MLISPELAKAIKEQIGRKFGASLQYLSIAGHFYTQKLTLLAKLFFTQAEEAAQAALARETEVTGHINRLMDLDSLPK